MVVAMPVLMFLRSLILPMILLSLYADQLRHLYVLSPYTLNLSLLISFIATSLSFNGCNPSLAVYFQHYIDSHLMLVSTDVNHDEAA